MARGASRATPLPPTPMCKGLQLSEEAWWAEGHPSGVGLGSDQGKTQLALSPKALERLGLASNLGEVLSLPNQAEEPGEEQGFEPRTPASSP